MTLRQWFCVVFISIYGTSGAATIDEDADPLEKSKINKKERPGFLEKMLGTLELYADKGGWCPRKVLETDAIKKGRLIILELVLDLAFRKKLIIDYNDERDEYRLLGYNRVATPKQRPELIIAARVLHANPCTPKHALIAKDVYDAGHDFPFYYKFKLMYEAVCVVCEGVLNDVQRQVLGFMDFIKQNKCTQPESFYQLFAIFDNKPNRSKLCVPLAKAVFLMDDHVRDEIKIMRERAIKGSKRFRVDRACGAKSAEYDQLSALLNLEYGPDSATTVRREIGEAFWFFLQKHHQRQEGCPHHILEGIKGSFSMEEMIMSVICGSGYTVTFDELEQVYWLKEEASPQEAPSVPVEIAMAKYICHERIQYPLGQVLWNLHQGGYRFNSFEEFSVLYTAVRLVLNVDLSEESKGLRKFAFLMREKNTMKKDLLCQVETYYDATHYMVDEWGLRFSEKIIDMSQEIFAYLQKNGEESMVPRVRATRDIYYNIGVMKSIQSFIHNGQECSVQNMKRYFPKQSGKIMVLKTVLNHVFKRKNDIAYDGEKYTFGRVRPELPKPQIPLEIIVTFLCKGCHISLHQRTFLGFKLYKAGYDFDSYFDYESKFNVVSVLRHITVAQAPDVSRPQLFFQYIEKQKEQKEWKDLVESYRSVCPTIKDEDLIVVKKALDMESQGLFKCWGMTEGNFPHMHDMIARTLEEQAKHGLSASYQLLGLYTVFSEPSPQDVLSTTMDAVFSQNLSIRCDESFLFYTLESTPKEDTTQANPLWVLMAHNVQQNPLWSIAEHKYALHMMGFSPRSVENVDAVYTLLQLYGGVLQDASELFWCIDFVLTYKRCFFEERVDFNALMQDFREHSSLKKRSSARLIKEAHKFVRSGALYLEEFRSFLYYFLAVSSPQSQPAVGEAQPTPCEVLAEEVAPASVQEKGLVECAHQEPVLQITRNDFSAHCLQAGFGRLVLDSLQKCRSCSYQEIAPYVKEGATETEMMEFVINQAFLQGFCVDYVEEEDAKSKQKEGKYRFYLRCEKLCTQESPQEYIDRNYGGKEWTQRDRVECAYKMHRQGYTFGSFPDFCDVFSSVCMVPAPMTLGTLMAVFDSQDYENFTHLF